MVGIVEIKKNKINYLLLYSVFFLYSLSSLFMKFAANQEIFSFAFFVLYGTSLLFLVLYAVFWQQILKRTLLTTAFANKAVIIIFGMILGAIFFKEEIKWNMLLGTAVIIIGIYLVVNEDE